MKRVIAFILSMLMLAALSFAVIGCKKAEEQKPAEAPVTAPAPAPAPAPDAQAPGAGPAPAPAPAAK